MDKVYIFPHNINTTLIIERAGRLEGLRGQIAKDPRHVIAPFPFRDGISSNLFAVSQRTLYNPMKRQSWSSYRPKHSRPNVHPFDVFHRLTNRHPMACLSYLKLRYQVVSCAQQVSENADRIMCKSSSRSKTVTACRLILECDKPMPPHHPIFGHLIIIGGIMSKLPSDVHGHVLPRQITMAFPDLGPLFYIDTWPFGPPMLVSTSPDGASQFTIAHSLPKHASQREYMKPMTGGMDLTTLEGHAWKNWRKVFQPGFSTTHLMTKVPEMIKDISTFCEILREHAARGKVFQMDPLTVNLNLDIIGRLAL